MFFYSCVLVFDVLIHYEHLLSDILRNLDSSVPGALSGHSMVPVGYLPAFWRMAALTFDGCLTASGAFSRLDRYFSAPLPSWGRRGRHLRLMQVQPPAALRRVIERISATCGMQCVIERIPATCGTQCVISDVDLRLAGYRHKDMCISPATCGYPAEVYFCFIVLPKSIDLRGRCSVT